ncbi:MAG: 3-hydroxyacyl-CoA dehydrogenase NAD-binding domain-containing protein [Anaerolineales bacterium]|nr:3-hydroxyacyl-CoA dehydrogenase NAD-binding domain-containing protein [Anaerolineales bacterium]
MRLQPGIRTIGVCGLGQMGAAAAVSFKRAGYRVLAWDHNPANREALPGTAGGLESWLDEHSTQRADPGGKIETAPTLQDLDEEADVLLDCIVEDLEQKVALFKGCRSAKARQAIFITTTSGLSITKIGRASGCGHLLAGTHFWNPPHLMPLVEVIRGDDTPDEVMDGVCGLIESIGKIYVRVNQDIPGFIGNRMLHALWREAISLVEMGVATPEDIDLVARLTFGLRMPAVGPLENMDLVGLDLIERIHQYLLADIADNHGPAELLESNVRDGRLGVKSGRGFYNWSARDAEELIERRDRQIINQLGDL